MDVLLTGASGYIGLHVLKTLLDHGNHVIAVVRSEERAKDVKRIAAAYNKEKLQIEYVPDMAQPNAYDEVLKKHQVPAIIHTAISTHGEGEQIVEAAVKGMENMLGAIRRYAPQLVKFVFTSSVYSCVDAKLTGGFRFFTEKDWANTRIEDTTPGDNLSYILVGSSKAEILLWKAVASKKVTFDVVCINTGLVCGPPLQQVKSLEELNHSLRIFWGLVTGEIPQSYRGEYIDVRECAYVHYLALRPEFSNKRWLVFKEDFIAKKFVEIARLAEPDSSVDPWRLFKQKPKIDASTFLNDTKMKFRPLKQTVADTLAEFRSQGLIPDEDHQ